jgi:hypothetical protein
MTGFKIQGTSFSEPFSLIIEREGEQVKIVQGHYGWDLYTETEDGFERTYVGMTLRDAVRNAKEHLEGVGES